MIEYAVLNVAAFEASREKEEKEKKDIEHDTYKVSNENSDTEDIQ